jgi:hypothetical protein
MRSSLLIIFFTIITIPVFAQLFGKDFRPGAYYDTTGKKYSGLIAIDFEPPSMLGMNNFKFPKKAGKVIYYKADKHDSKHEILASTIKGFVMQGDSTGVDTFTVVHVVHNVDPEISGERRFKWTYDIVQVLFDKGPVKLYNYRIRRQSGTFGGNPVGLSYRYNDNYYYYGQDVNSAVEMRRKDFIEVMCKMLADNQDIVALIKGKYYKMYEIPDIVQKYNDDLAKQSSVKN